jgi:tetratricopeptide (TPR) repeat protein
MTKRSAKKGSAKRPSTSGAKGGPSTGHGLNYQIDLAIQHTLEFISRGLDAPHRDWTVKIEPRVVGPHSLIAWDLSFDPDQNHYEAKLKPKREDVQEWVDRVASAGSSGARFHLVYSKGAGAHLETLERLIRIGVESMGNEDEFRTKVQAEGVNSADPYLVSLGAQAPDLLSRMTIDQVPEYILKTNVDFLARQLAREANGKRLREFLFTKLHEGIPHRLAFSVKQLTNEARALGIQFQAPAEFDTSDLSAIAKSALIILQSCKNGLPTAVIATALNCTETEIETELEELKNTRVVTVENGLWSMKPLDAVFTSPNSQQILADALSGLLSIIHTSPSNANIRPHVDNVISLAKAIRPSHPQLVANAFTKLDKRLKQIGDKRLVWFLASLSIKAARGARFRDREMAEAEARGLICGTSWAFQRLHKIEKARVDADEAYKLSRDMGLDRTLAFCAKCIGRLCRLEAESMPNGKAKDVKLKESVELLLEAISQFGKLADFGPDDPEVGDCYSLLGRTYLVIGDFRTAWTAIRKASELIVDKGSKDYLDLVILNGDLEAARGNRPAATTLYDEALSMSISSDPEISEMRARAFFRSGLNEEALGNVTGAKARYSSAMAIWGSLQDEQFEAEAAWRMICIGDDISNNAIVRLNAESDDVRVRVEAANIHLQSHHQTGMAVVGQRSESPSGYWKQLIKRARQQVRLKEERNEREW